MKGKRIIIILDETDCCDSYATDEAIEKVQYLISQGHTSGNDPFWNIEEIEEIEEIESKEDLNAKL